MNLTNQERNLNKGSSGFLTNSVLIQELEKRLKAGTIKMEVINSVKTDPLTSRLFNLKKSSEEQNSNSSSFFNRNTLLWITLIGVAFLIFYPKRITVENEVQFSE